MNSLSRAYNGCVTHVTSAPKFTAAFPAALADSFTGVLFCNKLKFA